MHNKMQISRKWKLNINFQMMKDGCAIETRVTIDHPQGTDINSEQKQVHLHVFIGQNYSLLSEILGAWS